jgi:hypothetical protein
MRLSQCPGELQADGDDLRLGQRLSADALRQGFAGNVLHHEYIKAIDRLKTVDNSDMWMIQPRERQGFIAKALAMQFVGHTGGEFKRDKTLELLVERAEHDPHPALSDLLDNAVPTKSFADSGNCGHSSNPWGACNLRHEFSSLVGVKASQNVCRRSGKTPVFRGDGWLWAAFRNPLVSGIEGVSLLVEPKSQAHFLKMMQPVPAKSVGAIDFHPALGRKANPQLPRAAALPPFQA